MNTAIYTDQRSANIGIGFATPINAIRAILPQLRSGRVIRGVIGVTVRTYPLTKEDAQAFGLPEHERRGADDRRRKAAGRARPGSSAATSSPSSTASRSRQRCARRRWSSRPSRARRFPLTVYRERQAQVDEHHDRRARPRRRAGHADRAAGCRQRADLDRLRHGDRADHARIARELRLPRGKGGAIVSNVSRASPAYNAGVAPNDVILEVNRMPVSNVSQVNARAATRQRPARRCSGRLARRPGRRPGDVPDAAEEIGQSAVGSRVDSRQSQLGESAVRQWLCCFRRTTCAASQCLYNPRAPGAPQDMPTTTIEREIKLRFASADEARAAILACGAHAAARAPAAGRRAPRQRRRGTAPAALRAARANGERQEPADVQGAGAAGHHEDPRGARNGRRRRRRPAARAEGARPARLVSLREVPRGVRARRRHRRHRRDAGRHVTSRSRAARPASPRWPRRSDGSESDYILDSYRGLFLQHREAFGITGQDMVFDESDAGS